EPTAEKVGQTVLASGGNAIDAAVAAALVAAVAAPHQTGIGGYGGHMTLFAAKASKLTCIDFNSHAPAAARPDMFPLDAAGKVVGQKNMYGWLAVGVPGILAGLHLALTKYGTKPFREIVQPAIGLAREGFPIGAAAAAIKSSANQLAADPGSRALYFQDGQPLAASDRFRNPELAKLLESLAAANSVESFYRGEIAQRIAAAFAKNGGLVTAEDFAAYRAHEVEPLKITWGEWTIRTAPLTAGGATALHALLLLQELHWAARDAAAAETLQLQVEALRYAWQDRLELFGDPQGGASPLERVLQPAAIRTAAERIAKAVAARQPLPVRTTSQPDQGTIHLSAADREGNLAAVTLTHGGSFGARVTVPGLGLTLGHGMSRFDPHAGHPNAPGPHKRPLNNMCPTIVARGGRPLIALGARGGRKIPNAVAEVLLQLVAREKPLADAVAAPRLHTEGQLALNFEKSWPSAVLEELKARGYQVTVAASATVSAAEAGSLASAMR
ncbi:MAG TPA: gamma-glutamyltransferase, partial [Pirellulaceae bacterium]|nr:gamma-glutamyltransferase [Pirellulaceae bacterium]